MFVLHEATNELLSNAIQMMLWIIEIKMFFKLNGDLKKKHLNN